MAADDNPELFCSSGSSPGGVVVAAAAVPELVLEAVALDVVEAVALDAVEAVALAVVDVTMEELEVAALAAFMNSVSVIPIGVFESLHAPVIFV
jgi:hypothetical protein